jgi:hypothetical protein
MRFETMHMGRPDNHEINPWLTSRVQASLLQTRGGMASDLCFLLLKLRGRADSTAGPVFAEILENHRRPHARAADHRPCEDPRPMLLALGATWKSRLAAEEFHVLPTLAQRPAAAVRAQIAEPNLLCILVPHMTLRRRPSWMRPLKVSGWDQLKLY